MRNRTLHPKNERRMAVGRLCKTCRRTVVPVLRWVVRRSAHVRAWCPDCGGRLGAVEQTPDVLALVGTRPERDEAADLFRDVGEAGA